MTGNIKNKNTTKTRDYLRYCANLLRYKKGVTFANVVCNIVIFSYWAAMSFCFQRILNLAQIMPQGEVLSAAIPYLIGILGVTIINGAAIMICSYLDRLRAYHYQERTRANMLAAVYRREDVTSVAGLSGKIFEVLDDDIPASTFPSELITEVFGFVVFTITALVMMLLINWMVTLFIVVPISTAVFIIQKLSERMKEKRKASREAHDGVSGLIGDVTASVLSIKTAGAEEAILNRAGEVNRQRRKSLLADILFGSKTEVLLKGAVSAGYVIMMLVAASLIPSGKLLIGDFSLFILHLGTLASCVDRVVELVSESKKAEVSYERMLETIGAEKAKRLHDDMGLRLKPYGNYIHKEAVRVPLRCFEARGLSYKYEEGGGFNDVNLCVRPGELIVITGGIGSGKTTLLEALSGIVKPDSGKILWNGTDMWKDSTLLRPPMIASAPQGGGFFADDIRHNICLGYPAADAELSKALRLAVFDEAVAAMEQGLDTHIGNRGEALSGGQRQRLTLARMFLRGAELNIIDDNISGLDEPTLLRLLANIQGYIAETNRAVIIATNHPAFRQAAAHVLHMAAVVV